MVNTMENLSLNVNAASLMQSYMESDAHGRALLSQRAGVVQRLGELLKVR